MRLAASFAVLAVLAAPAQAGEGVGLFDVAARAKALASPDLAGPRAACLAVERDPAWAKMAPIAGLKATEGYGSDQSAEDFAWAVMILGGRALAGDAEANADAGTLLLGFAEADAFGKTEAEHDAYFALKRTLLPTIVTYAIVRDGLDDAGRNKIEAWLDPLVRAIDRRFDGDVDVNNHRYLADAVLMVWGSLTGDEQLYAHGAERYRAALAAARSDGGLPLEVRRGARALWYQRLALSELTVIAETAAAQGDDLYGLTVDGRSYDLLLGYLVSGLNAPALVRASASANYIPGPSEDYLSQDLGFLARRGNGRNFMAFGEAILARGTGAFARQRFAVVMDAGPLSVRPLIDDFVGGNATCFWGRR